MPRITLSGRGTYSPPAWFRELVDQLAEELKSKSESESGSGQPVILEDHFPTGRIRAAVLWDKWAGVPHEQRLQVIRQAYSKAESPEFNDNLTLIVGLTFPEARESGRLPFRVVARLRKSDEVTAEECEKAMESESPSHLLPGGPQLWFASRAAAEDAIRRLVERLPGSDEVWDIMQDSNWADEEA